MASCSSGTGTSAASLGGRRHLAEAEGDCPAEVSIPRTLVALHLCHALADAVALGFGNGRQDGEHQLADAVARQVAAEIEHVECDLPFAQIRHDAERVHGRSEHPIQFWNQYDVAGLKPDQSLAPSHKALGTLEVARSVPWRARSARWRNSRRVQVPGRPNGAIFSHGRFIRGDWGAARARWRD
jgi:hypothetical protein